MTFSWLERQRQRLLMKARAGAPGWSSARRIRRVLLPTVQDAFVCNHDAARRLWLSPGQSASGDDSLPCTPLRSDHRSQTICHRLSTFGTRYPDCRDGQVIACEMLCLPSVCQPALTELACRSVRAGPLSGALPTSVSSSYLIVP